MKLNNIFFLTLLGLSLVGCSHLKEAAKMVWGSSTRALEQARPQATRKAFRCKVEQCFDLVARLPKEEKLLLQAEASPGDFVALGHKEKPPSSAAKPKSTNIVKVFLKDRKKLLIVLMGMPGSIDTTEVGIFFSSLNSTDTLLEIVSLSPKAQDTAADIVFKRLAQDFTVP